MSQPVPYRNRTPTGWWVASYIQRAEWSDHPDPPPGARCLAWENTILLQAPDREAAHEKAVRLGSENGSEFENESGRKGRWVFEGLTSLLPVYEDLEDGAEILWREHANRTIRKVRSLVKKKEELEAFDDSDGER